MKNRAYNAILVIKGSKYFKIAANVFIAAIAAFFIGKTRIAATGIPPIILQEIKLLLNWSKNTESKASDPELVTLKESSLYLSLGTTIKKIVSEQPQRSKQKHVVMLIVLESLGLTKNSLLNKQVIKKIENSISNPIGKPQRIKYNVTRLDNENTIGGTLGTELRFLCNITNEPQLRRMRYDEQFQKKRFCLPKLIPKRVGESIYLHSGNRTFYRRDQIMKNLEFKKLFFQEETVGPLQRIIQCSSKPFCGDDLQTYAKAEKQIENFLHSNHNILFLTLLTVDTHAPYADSNNIYDGYLNKVDKSFKLLKGFIEYISKQEGLSSFIFVTSDHSPPIYYKDDIDKPNFVYEIRIN